MSQVFKDTQYSFAPNCRGRSNCKFWEKNFQVHLFITTEWPKPPPPSSQQLGTKEYFTVTLALEWDKMISDLKALALRSVLQVLHVKLSILKKLFESATSNLSVLDKILVCISRVFNFANRHFPNYLHGLIFAKGPKNSRNREILST